MKILHIITRLDQGGSAEAVMQICEGLLKKGHEVKIITGLTIDPQEDIKEYTKKTGVSIEVISELRREINLFLDLVAFLKLYSLIKKEKPLIVHTHTSKAGILGRWAACFAGVKTIFHSTHGHVFYGYFGNFKTKLFLWIERRTAKITKKITTLTNLEIEDYQRLKFAEREKFITIPYGIDTEKYQKTDKRREEIRKDLGLSSQDRVVGWIGRLVPVKDCGTFIKAASLLKDISPTHPSPSAPHHILPPQVGEEKGRENLLHGEGEGGGIRFLIVGDGPEKQGLKEMAEALGIKALFTGTRRDICDIMFTIDVLVLSSLNEGLGRVLLEAMAAGKPVAATNVGGVPEVVKDGVTGILVSPSNPEEMASAITKILNNPDMMHIMGEEGRRWVMSFDIQIAVENLEVLYKNVGATLSVAQD